MIYWGMNPWSTEAWTHDLLRHETMIYWGMNPWSTEVWTHDLLYLNPWSTVHEPMIYWGMNPWSTEAWTHDLPRHEPMIYRGMNPWSTQAWTHDLLRHEPMIYCTWWTFLPFFALTGSLRQQSVGRHVAPLRHIILVPASLCFYSLVLCT